MKVFLISNNIFCSMFWIYSIIPFVNVKMRSPSHILPHKKHIHTHKKKIYRMYIYYNIIHIINNIYYYMYIQVHLNKLECREKVHFFLVSYFKK